MYKCIKPFSVEKCDGDGFMLENQNFIVEKDTIWDVEKDDFRLVGGEVRLTNIEFGWLEISKETLEECFELMEKAKAVSEWN